MSDLSPQMREALEAAAKHDLRRVHEGPGQPAWPFPAGSLAALVRRGYLKRTELANKLEQRTEVWTITTEGRKALLPPDIHRVEPPVYMSRGSVRYKLRPDNRWAVDEDTEASGDYTTDPSRAVDWDPQMGAVPTIDPDVLDRRWGRGSAERQADAENPRQRARRLARSARRAA